ncbi:MAG TPA: YcaO-like family protein, partial [Bryobacteraceae bacterium]|nr:YcaO-like family protein [Bryobacteraceae bacterium]
EGEVPGSLLRPEALTTVANLQRCSEALRRQELDWVVLDLTRRDIGVPVVRCVVPELRPNKPRFARGRLYDVPIKMGWYSEPTSEGELKKFTP